MSIKKHIKKSKAYLQQKTLSILFFIPILIIIGIVPLIVFLIVIELNEVQSAYWMGFDVHYDFFSYYKSLWFSVLTFLSGIMLLYMVYTNRYTLFKSSTYIPFGIYAIGVFITYLFSKEKSITTLGVMEMYQGIFVLLGYTILVFVLYNAVKTKQQIIYIFGAFIFLGTMTTIIAITQYFGYDILRTDFGLKLILPNTYHHLADQLAFTFDKYAVYATMFNTNFVGSFAALMIPFAYALYLYQKKLSMSILGIIFFGAMVFIGFGSNSRAGILGIISAFILIFILYRKTLFYRPIYSFTPFIILIIVGFLLNSVSDGRVITELKRLDFFEDKNQAASRVHYETFSIHENTVTIETSEASFIMIYDNEAMYFYTLEKVPLKVDVTNHTYNIINEDYDAISVRRDNEKAYLYKMTLYGKTIDLYTDHDGLKVVDYKGELVVPDDARRIKALDGYESMFSSRVYLWTRSASLLQDYLIIGAGPDMFGLVFPQNDVAGRLNAIGFHTIIDKPHNMYLQIGINNGVIALLALLTAFAIYIVDSLKLYIKGPNKSFYKVFGSAMFISVVAYLITGFFNDQIISVAPIFYAIFGVGMAFNRINKQVSLDK